MKKLRVMILSIVMLMTITSISNAAQFSCKVGVTASKDKIKTGDTVTINFAINNLQLSEGAPGVTILDGFLEYDTNIFEDVKKSDINCGANRSVTYINANKRVYIEFENKDGMITKSGTTMFYITMKVKENAQFENTQVKLNNIIITDNNEEVKINSAGVLLQAEAEAQTTTETITSTNTVLSENTTKPSDKSETSNRRTDTVSSENITKPSNRSETSNRKKHTVSIVTTSDIEKETSEAKTTNIIQNQNKETDKNVDDIQNRGWLFNNDGLTEIENVIIKSITAINRVAKVLISICM